MLRRYSRIITPIIFLTVTTVFFFVHPAIAQTEDALLDQIEIQADLIDYSEAGTELYASGNVVLQFNEYIVTASTLSIDYDNKVISIPTTFNASYKDNNFSGSSLFFDFDQNTGNAQNISISVARNKIKGEKIIVSSKNITILNGFYTTCPIPDRPNYSFTTREIKIYPPIGLIILNDAYFSLFSKKILYIPTYVVANPEYGTVTSQAPLPVIGYNKADGLYIIERLGYFIDNDNTGTIDLGFIANRGFMAGFSHHYQPGITNDHYLDLHVFTQNEFPDNVEFDYIYEAKALHKKTTDDTVDTNPIDEFLKAQEADVLPVKYSLLFEIAHRKFINFEYVSFLPRLTLKAVDNKFLDLFNYNIAMTYARLTENNSPVNREFDLEGSLYKQLKIFNGDLTTGISAARYSSLSTVFSQAYANLLYGFNMFNDSILLELGYFHLFKQSGQVPFRYQQLDIYSTDYIDINFHGKMKSSELLLRYKYDTENGRFLDAEIEQLIILPCMKVGIGYRFRRNEYTFQFSLY